jgi:hypothetical protein
MKILLVLLVLVLAGCKEYERTDVNRDGAVDVLDIQLVINDYLDG